MNKKIKAFALYPDTENLKKAIEILSFLDVYCELFFIPSHRFEDHIESDMVALCFGKAKNEIKFYIEEKKIENISIVELPDLKLLLKTKENLIYRQEAYQKITEVNQNIEKFTPKLDKIKTEDLPDLNTMQIILVKKIMDDQNQSSAYFINKNNKLIEISNQKTNKKVDHHVTLEELFIIKSVMEVLQVSEISIERKENE